MVILPFAPSVRSFGINAFMPATGTTELIDD